MHRRLGPGEPARGRFGAWALGLALVPIALGMGRPAGAEPPPVGATGPEVPPVLLDPAGAVAELPALVAAGRALQAAELAILVQDPTQALDALRAAPTGEGDAELAARRLRLELDAYVLSGDRRLADDRLARLAELPGWGAHVRRAKARLALADVSAPIARAGGLAYALAFAFLVIGGGRELLRPRTETIGFAIALAVALGLARTTSPVWGTAVGIAGSATLVLVHAGSAAARRLAPRPRIRLLLALTLLLGALGAAATVAARLDPASAMPGRLPRPRGLASVVEVPMMSHDSPETRAIFG